MGEKMRLRIFSFIIIFILIDLGPKPVTAFCSGPSLNATSALLMDYTTGQILYQKNASERRPPASTTKMLTAIIAIESGNLDRTVIATKNAARADGSSIYLKAGEQHSLRELLYGILLNSGNDASIAVAENIAGSEQKFAERMTAKAHQIGAIHSHFQNCNGLPATGHFSTACDLAVIARYALHNPVFAGIVRTKRKLISWPGHPRERILLNHNKLLWSYQYADGVKTGYTEEAGRCLVSSATQSGRRLIVVVLKSKDIYGDSTKLFDYGFKNYQQLTLIAPYQSINPDDAIRRVQTQIPVSVDTSGIRVLNLTPPAPVNKKTAKRLNLKPQLHHAS